MLTNILLLAILHTHGTCGHTHGTCGEVVVPFITASGVAKGESEGSGGLPRTTRFPLSLVWATFFPFLSW